MARVQEFQDQLLQFVDSSFSSLRENLATKKEMTADIEADLKKALGEFKSRVWKK